MRCNSFLKNPKEEEQVVPDTVVTQFSNTKEEAYANGDNIDVMDELEGVLGIEDDERLSSDNMYGLLGWDFMDSEEYPTVEDEEGSEMFRFDDSRSSFFEFEDSHYSTGKVIKEESLGFWDGDEKRVSLNLNLNYQRSWMHGLIVGHFWPMITLFPWKALAIMLVLNKLIFLHLCHFTLPFLAELDLENRKPIIYTCIY